MASPPPPVPAWRWWHSAGLLALTLILFCLCAWVSLTRLLPLWWGVMVLLALAAVLVGQGINGSWQGILIDSRNKMSLSRLQLVLWTVLIVSALLVVFFWRLRSRAADPLGIGIPEEIWGLLGISTASLAGSGLIKTNKKNQTRNLDEENESVRKMSAQGQPTSHLLVTGREVLNDSAAQASWSDLFRGEESGNASTVSVGKFQMFYFTLVAVVSYGSALAQMFADYPKLPDQFPDVSAGLLGLLGISHGGYLADKAVPHTQDPAPVPPAGGGGVGTMAAPAVGVGRTARPMGQP